MCLLDLGPSWLVKGFRDDVRGLLEEIINLSFSCRIFPVGLTEAAVCPLLKTSTLVPANYHLILNPLFLGTIVESMASEEFQVFLDDTAILDLFQSGFCPGHGKEMVPVTLTNDLWRHLNRTVLLLQCLTWLIMAMFDMVGYDLMTHPLANIGEQETALLLFSFFLCSQGQRVLLCGRVLMQYPQRAILSSMLFSI